MTSENLSPSLGDRSPLSTCPRDVGDRWGQVGQMKQNSRSEGVRPVPRDRGQVGTEPLRAPVPVPAALERGQVLGLASTPPSSTTWRAMNDHQALCATVDLDLWTSDSGSDRWDAADMCWRCPVRAACFAEADELRRRPYDTRDDRDSTFRPWGVWGGHLFYGTQKAPRKLGPFTDKQRSARWKHLFFKDVA